MSEIKTVLGKIKDCNHIETNGELLRAVPMKHVNVKQFIGCFCYIQLEQIDGSNIILDIFEVEEENI